MISGLKTAEKRCSHGCFNPCRQRRSGRYLVCYAKFLFELLFALPRAAMVIFSSNEQGEKALLFLSTVAHEVEDFHTVPFGNFAIDHHHVITTHKGSHSGENNQ